MTSSEIRTAFLNFFASKNHQIVDSSSLVPNNDPTLLFANAGMNQFKNVFLGLEKRPYKRATSSQKCVRAGGKHNDLENVGYTARHHTFFEMLGNFSFGDYFKQDAITYAWEFLTSPQWLNLPQEKLWVTIYHNDDEAFKIWHDSVGLAEDRIIRIGDKDGKQYVSDNFWSMGDTGPCGPCTEIFYDHGEHIPGGLPGTPEEDGDRYIEIWNLVFMQFNRLADGSLENLPAPSVDTGMGLERISAVKQHVNNNYDIDIFVNLIKVIATELKVNSDQLDNPSLKVIADHLRSCSFLIADGVVPSNEGRGYVLRRIIRRAVRHGYKLGAEKGFFAKLLDALIVEMGDAYPQLIEKRQLIENYLTTEEEQFSITLYQGMKILEDYLAHLQDKTISGEMLFKLYDTYGFPVDLTGDIARERNLTIDMAGFEQQMDKQRKRAKAGSKFNLDYTKLQNLNLTSTFDGYYFKTEAQSKIIGILNAQGEQISQLKAGEDGILVLEQTAFFGEGGGQVGDIGDIVGKTGKFKVTDTQKNKVCVFHHGTLTEGSLTLNDAVTAKVDKATRIATACNHSATHLVHGALREILGKDKVFQKGSLVAPDRLRFDFSFPRALTKQELIEVENYVNAEIRHGGKVATQIMDQKEAVAQGALALFGETYEEKVRVLTMGRNNYSVELCGGTHVEDLSNIGLFHIISETAIASGIRRIEALTAQSAIDWYNQKEETLHQVAEELKVKPDEVVQRLQVLQKEIKDYEKQIKAIQAKEALNVSINLAAKAYQNSDGAYSILCEQVKDIDNLRNLHDQLKQKLPNSLIILVMQADDKINLLIGVNGDAQKFHHAGKMIKDLAGKLDGKGGGKADLAQAGAKDSAKLADVLQQLQKQLQQL